MNVKPVGGLNLVVSLAIIMVHNAKKSSKFRGTLFSILIITTVFLYLGYNMVHDFGYSPLHEFSLASVGLVSYENDCKIEYHDITDKNVVLRIDDIQANAWRDIQIRMITEILNREETASLGVIPLNLLQDEKISRFLSDNRCWIEIGLHGYNHSDNEFQNLTFSEADKKIKKGLDILNKIEPNVLTFIPPDNLYSNGTVEAMKNNGLEILSAGSGSTEYSFTQSSYIWKENSGIRDSNTLIGGCENDWKNNKTCVIMFHPQDYADDNGNVDETKYQEFIKTLDGLKSVGANVVNFRDLARKDYINLN